MYASQRAVVGILSCGEHLRSSSWGKRLETGITTGDNGDSLDGPESADRIIGIEH